MNYAPIFEKAYKGKKVLLTGHTGFKGSWMLVWLSQLGAIVKGYALAPESEQDLYNVVTGDQLCDSVIADIRDKEKLAKTVIGFQPDFIFHLAAQPLVRRSYEMPLYTFEVNVNGTAHLLEAVRALDKPCSVVIVTTDKVYENRETDYAYKETDKLGGYDPYSASKAAAEIVVSSYRDSFFGSDDFKNHQKGIASARAGNVIGPGDWAKDRILPDIFRALFAQEAVIIRNPGSIRPWQHVLEPLSGYLLLGVKLAENPVHYNTAWNFGPRQGDQLTVLELVKEATRVFGSGSYVIDSESAQLHEAGILRLDISKAEAELGWAPKMSSLAGIAETVGGYRDMKNGKKGVLEEQIRKFNDL